MTSAANTTPLSLQRSGLEGCLWAWRSPVEAYLGQLIDWRLARKKVGSVFNLQTERSAGHVRLLSKAPWHPGKLSCCKACSLEVTPGGAGR